MSPLLKPWVLVALLTLLVVSACGRLSGKESDLSYERATKRIMDLAEQSILVGLDSELDLPSSSSSHRTCTDGFGGPGDYVYPVVDYKFSLELLREEPDTYVQDVEDLWNASGLETTADDSERVMQRFGVSEDGFNYQITVNRGSGIVYVGGSGPCVDPPEE